jgi:magnesium-transporting ATPase (P-type)
MATFGFEDELRENVAKIVNDLYEGGTNTRIISGDHKEVVTHIARQLKIVEADGEVISGEDLYAEIHDLFTEYQDADSGETSLRFKDRQSK